MTTYNDAIDAANKAEYFLYTLEPCRVSWSWSLATGQTNTYEATCEREIYSANEDGSALTERASIALVEANAGSFYWDRSAEKLYVHMSGSDDPSGHDVCAWTRFYHRQGPRRGPYNGRNYEPRNARLHKFRRSLKNIFYGSAITQYGTYEFTNADGAYDDLYNWIFEGHPIECKHGFDLISDADYQTVLKGLMGRLGPDRRNVKIDVKGLDKRFKREILTSRLADAANVPEKSVDKWIPRCFGTCYSVKPLHTNESTHEYQVNDGSIEDVLTVYDDGVSVGFSKDLANGKFTLTGGAASGVVTADVEGDNTGSTFRELPGEIMAWIAENIAGFAGAEIDTTAVTAFDTARPYELGIYVRSQKKVKTIFDKICESVFGCYYLTRTGLFKPLAISAGAATTEDPVIYDHESDGWRFLRSEIAPVAKTVGVYYKKNWSDDDLTLCDETDADISDDAYPDAEDVEVESYLRDEADAAAVGALYAAYLNTRKEPAEFTAYNKALRLELMDTVQVIKDRYSIDGYYRVIGLDENLADGSVKLTII